MLQNHSKLVGNQNSQDEFSVVHAKMKQSLEGLTHIQNLLCNKQNTTVLNHDRISLLEQKHLDLKSKLVEKDALIIENQETIEFERNKYTQLEKKFNELVRQHQLQQENSQKDLDQLQIKNNHLQEDNKQLKNMVHELQELHESEVQRKEQMNLLLRENVQEQKNTTEAALERDRQIDELQQKLDCQNQQMDEKDQMIKAYALKESDKLIQMQEEITLLKQVNSQLSQELEVASKRQTKEQHQKDDDTSNLISCLEQELISSQAQLLEKKSQYQELESAMERVNEHCNVLRRNLIEVTEESADRYQRLLGYRDEIRLLKQALHNT